MKKVVLVLTMVGLTACAEKLTGPDAQQAAAAYREQAIARPVLLLVNGAEVDTAYLRKIDELDVESIEVIKGKAAVARFGPRAQKGAILVTTRTK